MSSSSVPTSRDSRWQYPENGEDLHRVFTVAKRGGPQQVFDGEGVFTVSYAKSGAEGSAKDFLSSGGPGKE
ncbi:hypothetical protein HFO21_16145 [Rhizobium laguerreae]|uniref:hypothetical protein n=1 Tax=Rhizobium laguerreae TaxID=1076926 RepID=UPI001C908B18|nr:hypothetical protein [Rhizobium laguerreae]MBY3215878.1 hypothetical protein [Rhizobium laguerreae]